jgi:hypothetical protein
VARPPVRPRPPRPHPRRPRAGQQRPHRHHPAARCGRAGHADTKRQLAQYRAALAAGADPTEVTAWINQATAAKAAAEAERARLRATTPTTLDRAALRRILPKAGGLLTALDNADRTRRAALYDKLGIEGVYQPTQRLVVVTADLVCQWLVSEGRLDHWAYQAAPCQCRYEAPSPRRSSVPATPALTGNN